MVDLKLKIDSSSAKKSINDQLNKLLTEVKKDFLSKYYSEIKINLISSKVRTYFFVKTVQVLAEMQSEYFGEGFIASEDPTAFVQPEYIRAVEKEIAQNFSAAAMSISPKSELEIVLLSDDFLGFGKEKDITGTAPIQWLVYFLVGSLGTDLYWVTEDTFTIFTGDSPSGQLGRFGVGHLWHITSEETKTRLNAKLRAAGAPSLEQLKHPQSGKQGRNWFSDVITPEEIQELVINPAVQQASKFVEDKYSRV